jgi:DNA adenine methylase
VTALEAPTTTALAPWFGSNRMLAHSVAEELSGCRWVGVPFAGGMSELFHIKANTIVACDLHRHVINLANVVKSDELRPRLIRELRRTPFHEDALDAAQERCKERETSGEFGDPLAWAVDYFVTCWMGRSSIAGIDDQFCGRLSARWNANGGDSATRFRNAARALAHWGRIMRRCSFRCLDAFEFLPKCEDAGATGIYPDPPFPQVGRRYRHNAGSTDAEERAWHIRLRDALLRFEKARVVCRFYDHPLIRELYPEPRWTWRTLKGRKQSNAEAAEVLILNGPSRAKPGNLF